MRLTVIAVTVAAGLAWLPAAASAVTYCVGANSDRPCQVEAPDLEAALAMSNASTIYVGAGTYTGTFTDSAAPDVQVVGRGPQTVLVAEGDHPAFTVTSRTTLEQMTLQGPPSQPVVRVDVADPSSAKLDDLTLQGAASGDTAALVGANVAVAGLRVVGATNGIHLTGGSFNVIADGRVAVPGVALDADARTEVLASVLESSGSHALIDRGYGVGVSGSVLRSRSTAAEAVRSECRPDRSVTTSLISSTVAAAAVPGVTARCNTTGRTAQVDIRNGSLLAPDTIPQGFGTGTVNLKEARWDGGDPRGGVTTPGPVVTDEPRFVSADDLRLRPDSPLVDGRAKDAQLLGAAADLDDHPRVVDGNGDGTARADFGAYETAPATPSPPARNLLRNGGAEDAVAGSTPEWAGTANALEYGLRDAYLPARRWSELFGGQGLLFGADPAKPAERASLAQTSDLTARAAAIDGFGAVATLSGLLGERVSTLPAGTAADRVMVTATFRDAAGAPLGEALTIGPVSADQLGFFDGLARRSATATVPKGARSVQTVVGFADGNGDGFTESYADNLSLTLADSPPPTEPGDDTGGGDTGGGDTGGDNGGMGNGGGAGKGGAGSGSGAGAGAGGGTSAPPVYAGPVLPGGRLKLDGSGRVSIPVSCPATAVGGCVGTLELSRPGGRGKASAAAKRRKRAVRLARAKVAVAAGKTQRVRLKLSRKARRGLREGTKVTLRLVTRDGGPGAKAVTRTRTVRLVVPK